MATSSQEKDLKSNMRLSLLINSLKKKGSNIKAIKKVDGALIVKKKDISLKNVLIVKEMKALLAQDQTLDQEARKKTKKIIRRIIPAEAARDPADQNQRIPLAHIQIKN